MFQEISYKDLTLNPITAFDEDWMLLSAGTEQEGYNAMTVSWGHLGCLWSLPTAVSYVRPQRYTKKFMDSEEIYALSWFGKEQRKALGVMGTLSGRDTDKAAIAGLTPVFSDGTVYFSEAKLVILCKKIYRAPLKEECFFDPGIAEEHYPEKDYHDMYVGQILKVLKNSL